MYFGDPNPIDFNFLKVEVTVGKKLWIELTYEILRQVGRFSLFYFFSKARHGHQNPYKASAIFAIQDTIFSSLIKNQNQMLDAVLDMDGVRQMSQV